MNPAALLMCLRPKQWTKNLLLFAGVVFAGEFRNLPSVLHAVAAFFIFCFLSGVVYIVNDILDVEKDRQHPKKKKRPIASGAISPLAAGVWAAVLGIGSLAASYIYLPLGFTISAGFYVGLVCAYSLFLKHMVILDILALAMGFVVRALAGIEALPVEGVKITGYFILTTLFLALFLAICKRRNELTILGEGAAHHRAVLREYSVEFLDTLLTVATAGVLFSYASWTTQGQFAQLRSAGENSGVYVMVFTMPFVIFGIFRYIWLVYQKDEGGAPEMLLVEDIPLLAAVGMWILATMTVLFGETP
jgi:4-hydroxybenzoate polyprenyltransferase